MNSYELVLLALELIFFASSATIAWFAWRSASKIRSQLSLQGEIAAIEQDVDRLLLMLRRIEGRQTGSMRPSQAGSAPQAETPMTKAELRAYFGLVPGKPVSAFNGRNANNRDAT